MIVVMLCGTRGRRPKGVFDCEWFIPCLHDPTFSLLFEDE